MRIVVTKLDLPEVRDRWPSVRDALQRAGAAGTGPRPIGVSAHDGTGIGALRAALAEALEEAAQRAAAQPPASDEMRVHRFDPLEAGWQVVAEEEGLRVRGRRIEEAANRTDFGNEESRERFGRLLERMGIEAELRRQGAEVGTTVRIGAAELEWEDE